MKRAIITGATGALGTALIKELIKNNIEVLVFCREDSKRNANIPQSPLVGKIYCSLNGLSTLQNTSGKNYDVFYHLAWDGTINPYRNDMFLQNQNVKFALDAVDCAERFGCKKFVGAGSQAEYGRFEGVLKSDTPCFPENGYGIAKLCAGQMTREHAHQSGLEHVWVRILSLYGPNDGAQSLVMSTINKLKNGETPQFTRGEQMWDYLYSGDAATAFRLVGMQGIDGKIYPLGSGKAMPLKDYINLIRDVVSPAKELKFGDIPYSDRQVMHLQADISELNADTGFTPKTGFKDGIELIVGSVKE